MLWHTQPRFYNKTVREISHAKEVIKSWLEAGYLYNGCLNITNEGTPQGGIISPVLANVALHSMEDTLNIEYKRHVDKIGNIKLS